MNAWLSALFEWAWRTSLQTSVLIALVFVAQAALRRWLKPKWQYALSALVLIRLLLPAVPESSFSILNLGRGFEAKIRSSVAQDFSEPAIPLGGARLPSSPDLSASDISNGRDPIDARAAVTAAPRQDPLSSVVRPRPWRAVNTSIEGNPIAPPIQPQDAKTGSSLVPAVKWAWALGFGLIALTAFCRHRRFTEWVKAQAPVEDTRIVSLLEDAKAVMGVTALVEARRVERLGTPALFGFRKPCLLVPAGVLERLDDSELRMVFLHELAHLKRRDILLNWIIILVRALHWFNPLVWLALRRLRADRELVCDEMVLAHLNADERRLYGNTLVKLLEHFSKIRFCPSLVPVINHKTEIKRRITMIAHSKPTNQAAAALSAGLLVALCCLTFTRAADKSVESPKLQPPATEGAPKPAAERHDTEIGKTGSEALNLSTLTNGSGLSEESLLKPGPGSDPGVSDEARKKLEQIKKLRGDTNQSQEAARLLQGLLREDGVSDSLKGDVKRIALLELAGIEERSGLLKQALQHLTEYVEQYPKDLIVPEVLLRQGYLLRRMGDLNQAISKFYLVLTSVLRIGPIDLLYRQRLTSTARSEIADTYFMQGKFKEAADNYLRLLKEPSEELKRDVVKIKLIRSLAKAGDNAGVVKHAEEFLREYPSSDHQVEVRGLLAAANASLGGKQESALVVAVAPDNARNEGTRSVAPGIAPGLRAGAQSRSVQVLEDQLKQHEEQLNQAHQRVDQLRRDLKVADIVPSDGAVRNEEPETARMIERDRVTAKSLQAQYETLHRSLRNLSKDAQRNAIPTASPDAILTDLLIKLSQAESEQASLNQEFGKDSPKLKSLSSLIKNLNAQIDARVEGILLGLETQAKVQAVRVAQMDDDSERARKRDAELTERYRPYFQAKRNLETQQRIYETIKLRLLQETVDAALPPGPGRNTKLPVPLTRDTIAFQPHYPGIAGTYDRIVVLGSNVGEVRGEAQSDKIIANLAAGAERARFAVARISMIGEHPELIERINLKRERLLDAASSLLASKTVNDFEKAGFRNLLKAEILDLFNEILGQGTLQEIVITEFVVQ